jgi:hypothetical protein
MATKVKRSKGQAIMDQEKINRVLDRAAATGLITRGYDRQTAMMDLESCMENGVDTLDLDKLLSFPPFDFTHDICGIARHMDRSGTWPGKLGGCFLPRCAAPTKPKGVRP